MGSIGPSELLVIALVVMLLFGAGRIADIGKGLGQGIRNFKQGLRDEDKPEAELVHVQREIAALESHVDAPSALVAASTTSTGAESKQVSAT